MAKKIFISYRRDDAKAEARSIYQHLEHAFGRDRLFMDVDSIQKGINFTTVLAKTLSETTVMLVVMGRTWLHQQDESGRRRLDDPADYVRLEVANALKRNIPVIPVRVDGARLARIEELPDDLKELVLRQGTVITHENFDSDLRGLERDIRGLIEPNSKRRANPLPALIGATLVLVLAAVLGLGTWWFLAKVPATPSVASIARPLPETETAQREVEARRRVDGEMAEEARRKAMEIQLAAVAEAKRIAEADAQRRMERAKAEAEADAMRRAHLEQLRQADEARKAAEQSAREVAITMEQRARARKAEIAAGWKRARQSNTLEEYLAYLRTFRDAGNRDEARALASPLLKASIEAQIDNHLDSQRRADGTIPFYVLLPDRPRAGAVCIDWASSIPEVIRFLGRGTSGHPTNSDLPARERESLGFCQNSRKPNANCTCEVVRRNDEKLTKIPVEWIARQLE